MSSYQAIRPRSMNPNDDESSIQPNQAGESSISRTRKRKAPASISQNACTACKKARAKCDGVEGQPCSRCISKGVPDSCQYELHVKTVKEELVRKIRDLERIIEQQRNEIAHKNAWIQAILAAAGPGTQGSSMLGQIQGDSNHPLSALANALSRPPSISRQQSGGSVPGVDEGDSEGAMDTDDDAPSRWTRVTQDDNKIHHLMALYFAWVHPTHMIFSERHFINSFKNHDLAYCSSALVNAICAMGCRYCLDKGGNDVAINRLGERFAQQVWAELKFERSLTPLSAVTYAIMFLLELSTGQARSAFSHLRLAIDTIRDVNWESWSQDAYQITYFGINTMNINWAALTYQKPPDPPSHHEIVYQNVELDRPGSSWQDYKYAGDAANEDIPTRALATSKEAAKLALINLDVLTAWCGSAGKMTASMLLELYRRYLAWKTALPPELTEGSPHILPNVLQLHITYHTALCQLFNPLLESPTLHRTHKSHIRALILQFAQSGLAAAEVFTQRFSNRYASPLQAYSLLHLSDIMLRQDARSSSRLNAEQVVHFCLSSLGQALPGFPVVGPLQAMFCETVLSLRLELPRDVESLMGGRGWETYSMEDKLGASERRTYSQPVDLLARVIDSSLPGQWAKEWDKFAERMEKEEEGALASPGSGTGSGGARSGDEGKVMSPMDIGNVINR